MKKNVTLSLLCLSIFISNNSSAEPTVCAPMTLCEAPIGGTANQEKTTRWYTGLIWQLGANQGLKPDIVFGVRTLTVKNIDSVTGNDANIRVKIKDSSLSIDSARLAYVSGKPSALGNIGLGYSFTHNTPIATAAVQANHLRLSTDYLFSQNKFQYFGEVNTLKKPEKLRNGQLSCSNSIYTLRPISDFAPLNVPSSVVVDGNTCVNDLPE